MTNPLLTKHLKCPHCGSPLCLDDLRSTALCSNGHSFTIRDNVIDFAEAKPGDALQQQSAQSFGAEWTK